MPTAPSFLPASGIRDNHHRGSASDFLREKIQPGSALSIVSAYFTIYAFEALQNEQSGIDGLRFLSGEPRFVSAPDPQKTHKKSFRIEDTGLSLQNRLGQKKAAQACDRWIENNIIIYSQSDFFYVHCVLISRRI